jgi:hypothetical protein
MAVDGEPAEPLIARSGALLLPPAGRVGCIHRYRRVVRSKADPAAQWQGSPLDRPRGGGETTTLRQTALPPAPPLPSNGLPAQIDLKSALRLDLTLGAVQTGWIRPEKFVASAAPAFRAKAGHPFGLADCLCSGRASPLSSRRRIRRRGAETRPVALPASLRQSNRGRPRGQPRRASRPR